MRLQHTLLFLLGLFTTLHALALPAQFESWTRSTKEIFKRKGGGGGRGGSGSGGSGGTTGSTGSSGGSRGSGSSSTTPSTSSPGRTYSNSNAGGSSSTGTGPTRAFGGGSYYGGGAAVPYSAGATSRGVTPYLLGGAALGGLAILPGLWLYSVYAYSWPGSYHWHNNTNNANETGPVDCLCQQYSVCGCEANNDTSYLDSVANNQSVASRAANGTLYINGTLPNGTTAPGGEGAGSSLRYGLVENSGYWFVFAGVTYAVSLL